MIALFFAAQDATINKEDGQSGFVYVFQANHDDILSYDSDRALLISTLPKMNKHEQDLIKKYCEEHSEERITPEIISKNSDGLKINLDTKETLAKYVYECERERHAFHRNHKIKPTDLTKTYFAKPRFTNERLKSQDGLFILFGLGKTSVGISYEIEIKFEHKEKILAELFFFAGITNSKIFHGLKGLSKDNKEKLYNVLFKS